MRKLWIALLVVIMVVSHGLFAANKVKFVRIDLAGKSANTIQSLGQLKLDITYQNRQQGFIEVIADEQQLDKIHKLGLSSEPIIDDLEAFEQQLRTSNYFDPFHSYEEMVQEMQQLQNDHPDLAMMQSLGKSWEGRDIWAIKISDNVSIEEADEAEALFMANIHAREMITPEIIMYFMHWLIDKYNLEARATYLVNHRQLWLIPTINPDGRVYVFTGTYNPGWLSGPIAWRKNKRDNNNNHMFDSYYDGVDLNRNFGYMWGLDVGSSSDPGSDVYRGPYAFSEPESQAIKNFVEAHRFVISLSYHSYGRWWIFPWGYTSIEPDTPDHPQFVALADSCVAYNGYTPANGNDFSYLVSGDTDDWLYGEQGTKPKIFAFTPEVGSSAEGSFWPDTSLIPKLIDENMGPNIFMAFAAGEEPIIEHVPLKETENPGPYPIFAWIKPPILLTTPVPLDTATFKVFFNATGIAPFDSVQLQPTGNPNEFYAAIPGFPGAEKIYYCLSASDQKGRTGWMPRGAPMATYSIRIGADLVPPVISHTPITAQSIFAKGFTIRAKVTDNIGVSQVKLLYRKNGGELDSLEMLPAAAADEFQATIIPVGLNVGDYYEYKIVAVDNSRQHNQARSPLTGFYRFDIRNSLLYDFELEASFAAISEGDWEWGTPTSGPKSAHSGSRVWATNLEGNYTDVTESILETPSISLADRDSAKLTFWHWYQNEFSDNAFWDGGNVKISVDGGPFQILYPQGGYDGIVDPYNGYLGNEPCFGGPATNGNFWQQEFFDLSAYANHSIKIRFHFGSDGAVTEYGWYIDDVEILFTPPTAVAEDQPPVAQPLSFDLRQNYPNPFNPATEITYSLEKPCRVQLEIFNLTGQKIKTLVNATQPRGQHLVIWNGDNDQNHPVASGIYFYQLTLHGENFQQVFVKKMLKLM